MVGAWELVKIEQTAETLYPDSGKYKLVITQTEIKYILEVNWCFLHDWKIIEHEIIADPSIMCTKICCDDRYTEFYKKLNYTGKYQFSNDNSILIIKNKKGVFYLKRSRWNDPD
ncbi:MAG: hypothetical protein COA97_03210 [Flavobacteriales bacterium]|nr:MAG: hypothetical protein COA97_03210 [Flavobacteriales bacterium]